MLRVHELPMVGTWYWDLEHSERFEIVATDNHGEIEIQYFDGGIEEIDFDIWCHMRVVAIAPPEDWTGPYEVERDRDDIEPLSF